MHCIHTHAYVSHTHTNKIFFGISFMMKRREAAAAAQRASGVAIQSKILSLFTAACVWVCACACNYCAGASNMLCAASYPLQRTALYSQLRCCQNIDNHMRVRASEYAIFPYNVLHTLHTCIHTHTLNIVGRGKLNVRTLEIYAYTRVCAVHKLSCTREEASSAHWKRKASSSYIRTSCSALTKASKIHAKLLLASFALRCVRVRLFIMYICR